MQELLRVIVLWLSTTFGLPEASEQLQVRYLPPGRIAAIRCGPAGAAHDVVAVYSDRTRTIYLRNDWDDRSIADVSVLVHELVHHLQHQAGTVHACPEEREALAYEAQQRWLHFFGSDLESAFGLDRLTLKLRTECLPY